MIKVLVLQRESHVAPGVASLSVTARITEVLDYLVKQGELVYASIFESTPLAQRGLDWANTLILSKHNSNDALALVVSAKQRGLRVIYDVDDWIFSFPDYSGARNKSDQLDTLKEILKLVDVVTVSNEKLMLEIRPYCEEPVFVPNGMYVEKYARNETNLSAVEICPPRIVLTNADFLKVVNAKDQLLRAFQVFFYRHPEYILDFYGDPFPEMSSLPFLHFTNRMPYSDYITALCSGGYQFAITPLGGAEDEENVFFNGCKNPFKYLNYGAAKVPGIYSNSAIYEQCITPNKTGMLVENTYDGWINAMENMVADAQLRQDIRNAAYTDVMGKHHIRFSANALLDVIKGNN